MAKSKKEQKQDAKKRRKLERRLARATVGKDGPSQAAAAAGRRKPPQSARLRRRPLVLGDLLRHHEALSASQAFANARRLPARITDSLTERRYGDSLTLLSFFRVLLDREGRQAGGDDGERRALPPPPLGTIQRWISMLGDGTTEDPLALALLDAMLRVSKGLGVNLERNDSSENSGRAAGAEDVRPAPNTGRLKRLNSWDPIPNCPLGVSSLDSNVNAPTKSNLPSFNLVATILGKDRTPPNLHDLNMYMQSPKDKASVVTSGENPRVLAPCGVDNTPATKVEIVPFPFAPNAFVLTNLLSEQECHKFVELSEKIGYVPDVPSSIMEQDANGNNVKAQQAHLIAGTESGGMQRAANVTILATGPLLDALWSRCKDLLPRTLDGGSSVLVGLNARFRLYRYYPGSVYRPHVDGAWPSSALCPKTGQYLYDSTGGKHRSRFTFLLYLNEGFEGGCTTFFQASDEGRQNQAQKSSESPLLRTSKVPLGLVCSQGVTPRRGCALVFPHGEGSGSLVHEGSALVKGTKYVVRTDVLYARVESK